MTDLEMTVLCAKAMDYKIDPRFLPLAPAIEIITGKHKWSNWGSRTGGVEDTRERYDPLHNDAQAMTLVKRFNLTMYAPDKRESAWIVIDEKDGLSRAFNGNLNRAIVECVAKMQTPKT